MHQTFMLFTCSGTKNTPFNYEQSTCCGPSFTCSLSILCINSKTFYPNIDSYRMGWIIYIAFFFSFYLFVLYMEEDFSTLLSFFVTTEHFHILKFSCRWNKSGVLKLWKRNSDNVQLKRGRNLKSSHLSTLTI